MTNGIINVYKEKGYTSFDVVARLRGIYHQKKIGHTGTLDPDAEGVLPVCLGKATRVCDLLTDKDKEYEAQLLLGVQTDTQDLSGTVLSTAPVEATAEEVAAAIRSFVGAYDQIPPMYSALKVGGQKLCDLARKGVTVERKARRVHIYGIEILEMNLPEVKLSVSCSKGTYIRTLCQDIGEKLGCGGCMKSLVRTKVSDFLLADAHRIAEIEADPMTFVRPVDTVFLHYAKAVAAEGADKLLLNGNRLPEAMIADLSEEHRSGTIRLYDSRSNFIGLYAYRPEAKDFKPIKLFME
jgi:tRNA pseudouridine55 synthase